MDTYENCIADVRVPAEFTGHLREIAHRLQKDFPGLEVRAMVTSACPRPVVSAVRIPDEHKLLTARRSAQGINATVQANVQASLDLLIKDLAKKKPPAGPGLRPQL